VAKEQTRHARRARGSLRLARHRETLFLDPCAVVFAAGSGGGRRFAGIGEPVVGDDAKQEKAREKNAKAHIIVRCYVDDFAEILETLGANEVIASSKSAFDGIALRLAAK